MLLKQSLIDHKILLYRLLNKYFPKSIKIIKNNKKNVFMLQINKNNKNIAFCHTNIIVIQMWSFNFVKNN
jgi:hypothetical protein